MEELKLLIAEASVLRRKLEMKNREVSSKRISLLKKATKEELKDYLRINYPTGRVLCASYTNISNNNLDRMEQLATVSLDNDTLLFDGFADRIGFYINDGYFYFFDYEFDFYGRY